MKNNKDNGSIIVASRSFMKNNKETLAIIMVPEQVFGNDWRCECIIKTDVGEESTHAYGVDSLQALELAIKMLEARIKLAILQNE